MLKSIPPPILQPTFPPATSFPRDKTEIEPPAPAPTRDSGTYRRRRTSTELPPLVGQDSPASRAKSPTFLPFFKPTRDRSISPERVLPKEAAEFDFKPTSKGDQAHPLKIDTKGGHLSGWFNGTSDPVNITLVPSPSKEKPDPFFESTARPYSRHSMASENLTRRPPPKQRMSSDSVANPAPSSITKFKGLFKARTLTAPAGNVNDDLANLDISSTLFPSGPTDEYSPAAFKNLQMNAEGALRRFQVAYQENLLALRTAFSEKSVHADELEASQTRNEHLQMQLASFAEKAVQLEARLSSTNAELAAERQRKWAGNEAKRRSIRIVGSDSVQDSEAAIDPSQKKKRISGASSLSETGSEMSSIDSVFSDALQPESSPLTSASSSPYVKHISTFTPLGPNRNIAAKTLGVQVETVDCQKCHGIRSTEAWDVISMMKEESRALKDRISQLECAQHDALDFLNGLGLPSLTR